MKLGERKGLLLKAEELSPWERRNSLKGEALVLQREEWAALSRIKGHLGKPWWSCIQSLFPDQSSRRVTVNYADKLILQLHCGGVNFMVHHASCISKYKTFSFISFKCVVIQWPWMFCESPSIPSLGSHYRAATVWATQHCIQCILPLTLNYVHQVGLD